MDFYNNGMQNRRDGTEWIERRWQFKIRLGMVRQAGKSKAEREKHWDNHWANLFFFFNFWA